MGHMAVGDVAEDDLALLLLAEVAVHDAMKGECGRVQVAQVLVFAVDARRQDGQFDIEVEDGDTVDVSAGAGSANFIRVRPPAYFYRTLMKRLKWNM